MGRTKIPRDSSVTQQQLMKAALDIIGDRGLDGATARAIADSAGVNQSLVFYYFGSVTGLIIEAVGDMSRTRIEVYKTALQDVDNLKDAINVVFEVFMEDRKTCSFMVLSQFVAGAQNNEEISGAVEKIYSPWLELIQETLEKFLGEKSLPQSITYEETAMGLISLFMGIQFMASIPTYENQMEDLFKKAPELAPILNLLPMLLGGSK